MDQNSILGLINDNVYGIWFLVGAALVFFMQCGFAMVEAGFTRAKNAGNIIMKNLMDFCLGTVVFILIGFGLLCGEDLVGIIGKPGFDIFSDYANFDWSSFVFNLVFCATAATIVSGAMAERTKFISYCIYSAVISAVIYPVETHWVWGGGWLSQLSTPFHDFAGSGVIHMVGGISALIGAAILGPRIGKFTKTKDGKVKVNAIPGHSLTIGALGVFILWFGWYGFNGAAATSVPQLGTIFLTTTIAPALATVSCMIFTWIKYGKPDVSMCLNASLAGLVAITAGCDVVDAFGLMNELIEIFIPPENATREELEEARKNMDKYADYRTYLSFDMQQIVQGEKDMRIGLSKMIKKNSGGEGQNPLYIALLASFAQIYRINLSPKIKRPPTLRLVVLDEAFSKMDAEKVASCISLIRGLGFQAIISATNDKIQNYLENVDKTFVYANPNKRHISIQEFERMEFEQLQGEE